jgi:hypothetical protein
LKGDYPLRTAKQPWLPAFTNSSLTNSEQDYLDAQRFQHPHSLK